MSDNWLNGDWMQTFTGQVIHPTTPHVTDINPIDIAHSLSLLCRYGGHTRKFYSVAEHCVLISHAVDPKYALWGLLHDATEAYLGDVVRPLKLLLHMYREIEHQMSITIANRFNIPVECPLEVHDADRRILHDECIHLLPITQLRLDSLKSIQPLGVNIKCWNPNDAENYFLQRLYELWDDNT